MAEYREYRLEFPFITFGTGVSAQAVDRIPFINDEGVEGVQIVMRPTTKLRRKYHITEKDLKNDGTITRWYANSDVFYLDPERIIILTGFNGESPTPLTELGGDLLRENKELKKEIRFYKATASALREKNYYLAIERSEGIRKDVEAYQEIKKLGTHTEIIGKKSSSSRDLGEMGE